MKRSSLNKAYRQGFSNVGSKFGHLETTIREGLLETVVRAGIEAVQLVLEQERSEICGNMYTHKKKNERSAYRGGHTKGELVLGGRRLQIDRPRARSVNGKEVSLPSWKHFSNEDILNNRALEQMIIGVATRKYERSLETLPLGIKTRGTSKSAVSRRFVALTRNNMDMQLSSSLKNLDIICIMIDGIHFADHVILAAIGVDIDGNKHILGLTEGATENATACKDLIAKLNDRGLSSERSFLFVLDGAKALSKAVKDSFGVRACIQRCQVHKKRNVLGYLPEEKKPLVGQTISAAYKHDDYQEALNRLKSLAQKLKANHPSASASLLEGVEETLTLQRLKIPAPLAKSLHSTNLIENLFSSARHTCHRVRKWKGGEMVLRWATASIFEASKRFRRLRGYKHMPILVDALRNKDSVVRKEEKKVA